MIGALSLTHREGWHVPNRWYLTPLGQTVVLVQDPSDTKSYQHLMFSVVDQYLANKKLWHYVGLYRFWYRNGDWRLLRV